MGSLVLLDLLGGVALLLWGLHMVLTGVLRAFGPDLRRFLNKALRNRFSAFVSGLGLTALLQSSTATGLMTTSLAADGLVGLVPALAIMLGANVGTTLIVQVLSFNISAVAPIFFVVGVATFRVGGAKSHARARPHRDWARTDPAGAPYPDRHAGAGRTGAARPRAVGLDYRRSHPVHRPRRGADLGGAFKRRGRAAGDVAGIFAFRLGRGGAGNGARRQSGQRDQSADRRRHRRQPGEPPAAARQSDQPAGRRTGRAPLPAGAGARTARLAARRLEDDGRIPHAVQHRPGADFHRPA